MKERKEGFTLIELIMVIVILGILAAVAIPKFVDLSSNATKNSCRSMEGNIASACSIYYANEASRKTTGHFPDSVSTLMTYALEADTWPVCPGGNHMGYVYDPATGVARCSNAQH